MGLPGPERTPYYRLQRWGSLVRYNSLLFQVAAVGLPGPDQRTPYSRLQRWGSLVRNDALYIPGYSGGATWSSAAQHFPYILLEHSRLQRWGSLASGMQ